MRWKPSFWSLAFPIGIIIWSGYQLIEWNSSLLGIAIFVFKFPWVFAAAIILGGFLPIILTLTLKIETREYFLPRLIIYVVSVGVINISRQFVTVPRGGLVILTAVSSAITMLYFYQFHKTRFSEWCIIFISTPQIYMMAYYLLLDYDIMEAMSH